MSTTELLHCPFCGGEAELVECDYGMYETGYAVYCKGECRAKLGVTGRLGEAYEWAPVFNTEAEAIEAWNTRAERTCHNTWDCELTGRLRFQCSECDAVSLEITPMFCPNCCAKVVEQ